ncbi:MAG: glycerophosphodiester phosphodiesterase [Microcoleaceae cyanobacterium]
MDWISSRPIAHRGLHNGSSIPENSLKAFEAAIAKNYPIELDIHPLADGEIAVFHDKSLKRMTGADGDISEQDSIGVKRFRLLATDQEIPLLDEAFQLVNGQVPILVELKNEGDVGQLEQNLLNKLSAYSGEYAVQSFNPFSMSWFKQNAPHIYRGQLSSDFKSEDLEWHTKFLLRNLLMNWASSPHFIAYDLRALPYPPVTLIRRFSGIPLVAWTIRNETEKAEASKYADNVIFENLELDSH